MQIIVQVTLGAVEIHVHSYKRYSLQHELNKDYNEVVLHVVLCHNENLKIEREAGRIVSELELAHFLNKEPTFSEIEKIRFKILVELSGRCGVAAFLWSMWRSISGKVSLQTYVATRHT